MSAALDMTLDDIIKNNKKSASGNSRGRARGSGPGPARRFSNRAANRATPYAAAKAPETTWQHDMYADQHVAAAVYPAQGGRAPSIETGTKLYISNLDYGVSNDDIKVPSFYLCANVMSCLYLKGTPELGVLRHREELFSEVGDMKRHGVHYDRSGRSKGTAEVVFSRRVDAVAAVKRYNNVQLDGKPMKIEIVGTNISTPGVAPAANVAIGNSNGVPQMYVLCLMTLCFDDLPI
ncbi:RNA-binding domain superfamily [Sesbania bispinosa]|nr:RNA-binding domain superfamily [Sesbania bispinosa]